MGGYSKTIIAPIVAVLALVVGSMFKVTIDEDTKTQIIDGASILVGAAISIYGIIKNHKKS